MTTAPAPTPTIAKKGTITAEMSKWAASLRFEDLSKQAVYQAKRFLLDSVGCALGGYQQHDVVIALEVLREIAGVGNCTVIGSGEKIDPVSASLANALMFPPVGVSSPIENNSLVIWMICCFASRSVSIRSSHHFSSAGARARHWRSGKTRGSGSSTWTHTWSAPAS